MSTTNINGINAMHCVITDACHKHHGGPGSSFQEAVDRIRTEYFRCLKGWGDEEGVDYHLVLTIDSPRHKKMREDAKLKQELDDAEVDAELSGPEIETPDPRSGD